MDMLKIYFEYFMFLVRQQMAGASIIVFMLMSIASIALIVVLCTALERLTGKTIPDNKKRALLLMAVYACFIFQIAFYRRFGMEKSVIHTRIYFGFRKLDGTMDEKQVVYSFLNVVFFVPWGLLMASAMENNFRRLFMTCIYSFLTSLTIEVMQYITQTGASEVTDLVTNVTGGMLGCLLFIVADSIYKRTKGLKEGKQ